MKHTAVLLLGMLVLGCNQVPPASSQTAARAPSPATGPTATALRNQANDAGQCLDIVNDGTNNQLRMGACGNFSGQQWFIERMPDGVYAKLRTRFTGPSKCLDVVNDGRNDKVQMATCGNFTGQLWEIIAAPGVTGFSVLQTWFTGPNQCLDIVRNQPRLVACGVDQGPLYKPGQLWRVAPASAAMYP